MDLFEQKRSLHLLDNDQEFAVKEPIESIIHIKKDKCYYKFRYDHISKITRIFSKVLEGDYEITYFINIKEQRKLKLTKIKEKYGI